MAAPKQGRTAAAAGRSGGGKSRNKGTRGGRPDPVPAAGGAQRRDNGPQRGNGQQRTRQARPPAAASPATRAAAGGPADAGPRTAPLAFQLATWLLALAGLGVSIYLTVAHFTSTSILACSDKGFINCAGVTTSPESMVFGIFPVAVLGLAFYVFMAAATSPWAWRASWPALRWARLGSAAIGMAFVLYLIYTELITLNAICLWCTSIHVITFLLFALIVFSAAAGYGTPRASPRR